MRFLNTWTRCSLAATLLFSSTLAQSGAPEDVPIRLPRQPRIAPDGQSMAFTWREDVWTADISGGAAKRLTLHPASDSSPSFHPDGEQLAFSSNRSGASQLYVMPVGGGAPRQITFDSHRKTLLGYTADGSGLLVSMTSDAGFRDTTRLYVIDAAGEKPKRLVFDLGYREAALSPDGQHVLFTLGRAAWSRKGYEGPQATQMWHADLTQDPTALQRLDQDRADFQNVSWMNPMWAPDSRGFYYVSDPDGTFDVYFRSLDASESERITDVGALDRSDDGVAYPSLSADGTTLLFRRRFDLISHHIPSGKAQPIALTTSGDNAVDPHERRIEKSADSIAFTGDGKQMAFVSGEDLYVMDRILREPRRVTRTPHAESSPLFNEDGTRLFFISDAAGEVDIWEATHEQEDGIWWLAEEFNLRQVTDDRAVEAALQLSPTGEHVAYHRDDDLFVMDSDGGDHRRIVELWSAPSFDWSPDGKWLTYATQDDDYNSDIYIVPLDGTREPYNLSRHPDSDRSPVWSPDGERLAFVSRRDGEESDIYYFHLTKQEEETTGRDRKLEEALEAMKKGKKGKKGPKKEDAEKEASEGEAAEDKGAEAAKKEEKDDAVRIDFDGIHDRMHRIRIADSREGGLIWSPDGKKLGFSASIDGERGFYTVEFPDPKEPKRMASSGLGQARWLKDSKEIVGLKGAGFFSRGGSPAAMNERGSTETFGFEVRRVRDWSGLRQIAFDQGWRAMRDGFYDEALNNRDWEAIRAKYRPVAAQCLGASEFSEMMNMMLGELNASHMGHFGGADPLPDVDGANAWSPRTYHLGLRFARGEAGPGLVVSSVIPGGPCHAERSKVEAGEVLVAIDGEPVGPEADMDRILTMEEVRDLELTIADSEGNQRQVMVRPTTSVAGLLYDEWVEGNRAKVAELSDGRLGYLHIRGMNMSSFRQMETDLYHAGHGKDGLVIDVRFNGGGSTTDHVLTALTQPVHAITQSRGSGEGYPQDRKIYASWSKPIVLMCNEHSFSNAEILSHAVRQIGRGPVVGMRTAGGVISTGSVGLQDGSTVRMPMRGWYLVSTGEDMELNGCMPDIALWNEPGGEDRQLAVAVETLATDVAELEAKGRVKLIPAATKRAGKAREASSKR